MKQAPKILTASEPDFNLIGVASHENDYRLAWAINSSLNIALAKSDDIVVFHDKYKHDISLSYYTQEFPDQGYLIKLFANRGDNFFLLEEYKNIDFFIKLEGESSANKLTGLMNALKNIDIIMGVYLIDLKKIKKIQRINF